MTRPTLLFFIMLFVAHISTAQTPGFKYANQKFSADTIKNAIDELTRELSVKHPGFYRYNSKEDFDKYIDSIKSTIKDSLTKSKSFLKLKPVITKIHCLHTGISLPKEYTNYLDQQPNLFPLQVYFDNNKAYIVKNYSFVPSIARGDEIVSING